MIFITVGSQKFQFNRLLEAADKLAAEGKLGDSALAQTGYSDYIPAHIAYRPFLDRAEYEEKITSAEIVVTHGGTGAIINALKKGAKVIAVPRLARFGEHVDDHQAELTERFDKMGLIRACPDPAGLGDALDEVKTASFKRFESSTSSVIASIEAFLTGGAL